MKLATFIPENPKNVSEARDGRLLVVHSDQQRAAIVPDESFSNLLKSLEQWSDAEARLRDISAQLEAGSWSDTVALSQLEIHSPLPRSWAFLDGSAFIQHIILVRKARGAEPPETLYDVPLMYQGASDLYLAPTGDIPQIDESHGTDFEAEVAVVLGDVPMGTKAADAEQYIKLIVLLNDISLRGLIPAELKTGFGFFHGKPNSAFAPFAVTADELGEAWKDGRVHLNMESKLNGDFFGRPNAGEMHFSFFQLIEHAAKTRPLRAGTVLGSGTISNKDESVGSSCLAERRMLEKINSGEIVTPFMKVGDKIEIEMFKDGVSVFGKIKQKVVQA